MELMMRDNNIGRRRKRACESCVLQNAGNVLPRVSTASTSASKYLLFLIMLIPPKSNITRLSYSIHFYCSEKNRLLLLLSTKKNIEYMVKVS